MTNPNAKGKTRVQIARIAREREAKALDLRCLGYSLEKIARELGWSQPSSASKAIERALSRISLGAAKNLRDLELERLDMLQRSLAAQIVRGHLGAIDRMLRIMDQRARLLGLYSPQPETGVDEVKVVLAAWLTQVRGEDEALDADLPDQEPQTLQGPPDGENSPQIGVGGV